MRTTQALRQISGFQGGPRRGLEPARAPRDLRVSAPVHAHLLGSWSGTGGPAAHAGSCGEGETGENVPLLAPPAARSRTPTCGSSRPRAPQRAHRLPTRRLLPSGPRVRSVSTTTCRSSAPRGPPGRQEAQARGGAPARPGSWGSGARTPGHWQDGCGATRGQPRVKGPAGDLGPSV